MNNILQLKGQFQKRKAPRGFGPTNLPKGKSVSADHVLKLKIPQKQFRLTQMTDLNHCHLHHLPH